ncbi:MAG: histidine triad nucleotide-binding protein [Patescibacteria group bacterium]|jgi:histidine triad (HIT) family protein|nr:histidine triad nucleotide-binding protein [Patescibacteria group bacterium]
MTMKDDCLFCSIANGDAEKLVWQNDIAAAFKDIHPQAAVHILVVPKQHILNLDHLDDPELAGQLLLAVREVAHAVGLKGGWRVRVNNGRSAGQVVDHLHFHVLGGQELKHDAH